jgi:hypothetical protein
MKARIAETTIFAALTYFLFASLLPAWAEAAQGSGYNWSLVRKGGKEKADTIATGTNDAAWIAGNYYWRDGSGRGAFRFQNGKFTEFSVPGGLNPTIGDIESSSTMVGNYWEPDGNGGELLHAYLYKHGLREFDLIDVPGAFWTFPTRVNANRQVAVGYFWDDGGQTRWNSGIYDWNTKQVTPITVFGYTDVVIRGLNNHGEMVGSYTVHDPTNPCLCLSWENGFYRGADGQEEDLTAPDGRPLFPYAINHDGVVVGMTAWGTGFKLDLNTGVFQDIPHPVRQDGFQTHIADIDNKGRMVAVNIRLEDSYTESWWLRPLQPKTVAQK